MIFTDASDTGYGGFTVDNLGEHICAGKFSAEEADSSSTCRELLAVKFVLQSYGNMLEGRAIQVNIDNQAATRILTVGSTKFHLHNIALDIFHHCIKHDIRLSPQWVPREQNKDADYFSRVNDTDSWGVDRETFAYIESIFGPFHVDRFADDKNKKVKSFNCKYYCIGTEHVNSFTINWKGKNNWLCPPVKEIPNTLKHLKLCKAVGTLLIPCWPSASWWPLFYPEGSYIATFVKNVLVLDPFYESYCENTAFTGFQYFKTLALKVDFS